MTRPDSTRTPDLNAHIPYVAAERKYLPDPEPADDLDALRADERDAWNSYLTAVRGYESAIASWVAAHEALRAAETRAAR